MRLSLGRARPVGGGASARSQAHGRAVCRCLNVSLRQIRRDRTPIFVRASESGSAEPNADSPEMKQMKEIAALDQLIDLMLDCKSQDELVQTVAQNILSFDQRFWMRLATRADITQEAEAKEKLQALASTVMSLVDAMVKKTENQLSDAGKVLQEIMVAAADDNGEWSMPLPPDKRAAMQKAMDERAEHLDEALLSNAFAWIRKVSEDRLDGMVALLQQVLQMYAAKMLVKQDPEEGADTVVNNILAAEEARWESMLEEAATSGMIGEPALMDALQKRMEGIVLSLPSGSYAQRVQAEYLKEVEARAKAVYKRLAEL